MIRLGSMLPQAFMVGITRLVDIMGPERAVDWLIYTGEELAKTQGPGFEGAPENDLNYLPLCPFTDELVRFIDLFGSRPEEFRKIVDYVKKMKMSDKEKVEFSAVPSTLCLIHHAYRAKRAQLAGAGTLHLACKCSVTDAPPAYNEDAIAEAGVSKEKVDRILEKGVCVFKFLKKE